MDGSDNDNYDELGLSDWPDVLDRAAAVESIAAFYEVVGHSADVGLTITSNFENEVKAHLEPAWAAAFMQDRGPHGRCMAKTMTNEDGRQVVIVDVRMFLKGAPSPVPTLRHEALHVLMHNRGESLNHSRDMITDGDGLHPHVVALAGIAAEEYRVERAVRPPGMACGHPSRTCAPPATTRSTRPLSRTFTTTTWRPSGIRLCARSAR